MTILLGALPPSPRDLTLMDQSMGGWKMAVQNTHGHMLRSPDTALGLLPSMALSSDQVISIYHM